ncbi:class I SAM-dependent DNA methyltransferase [Arthrobacter sp. JSM 101049]|uniref:class I SAM-dependent DNA methyltransferase n=1 Tax=Arthrobacter sp. JSM 101049 TaxID=929097 RepID=UPI00356A963E
MPTNLLDLVEAHKYQELFLKHLRWSKPDLKPLSIDVDGQTYIATNVSSYKGLRVWACPELPNSATQTVIDRAVTKQSVDRIVIFHDDAKQVWRWPSRTSKGGATTTRLTSHTHLAGRENPKLIDRLQLITLEPGESLGATEIIERVKHAFDVETERETKRASKLMAAMYDALEKAGTPEHDISVTLARILFLMFGDDTEMWNTDLFQDFILEQTSPDGSNLSERLNDLFRFLNTKPNRDNGLQHFRGFRYVNGGIFEERLELPSLAGTNLRRAILDACTAKWGQISPAIFGSMFQAVRDAKTRREFGEHYTSEKDILKTLEPLFLDELRDEFQRSIGHREERSRLSKLRERLGKIRFLDPACGCGNFIIIAYREMRILEISILERLRIKDAERVSHLAANQLEFGLDGELDAEGLSRTTLLDPLVRLENYFGIELDEWPAKIAETAMFLTDRQCDLQMLERLGYAPERLPISSQSTIHTNTCDGSQNGNALLLDWREVFPIGPENIIAGNPPFIGHKERTKQQGLELRAVWGGRGIGHLDYVTGWYKKAIDYFGDAPGRWAFVSTNSVTQGESASLLFPPVFDAGWRIKFGHRTFAWQSEAPNAAVVHCIIIGFDRDSTTPQRLFAYDNPKAEPRELPARSITPYLTVGKPLVVKGRRRMLSPFLDPIKAGSTPIDWENLVVTEDDFDVVSADPVAVKYLRHYFGGDELINRIPRWCLWLVGANQSDLDGSDILRQRIAAVRERRLASNRSETKKLAGKPHLFGEIRQPDWDYLGIPQSFAESRLYATAARLPKEVIASIKLFTMADPDGFHFGIVSSSMFITWQKTVGGRIKSDPSVSSSLVWNTLPLLPVSLGQRRAIIDAGSAVIAARALMPGRTLAQHYDPSRMSSDLLEAHRLLDAEVDRAFGAGKTCQSEIERQQVLFEAYEQLISGERTSSE